MPRSLWNGTISIGLLNVPVKLYTATESKTVRFHEVHVADGARIQHRRFCAAEGREVPYEEVVKGYEVRPGEYVVLDREEVKAAAGSRAHVIELEEFVDPSRIDPVFYEKTYYLGAGKDGGDGYRLLHDALERAGRAGIGRFTFHDHEYVVAVRSLDGVLALHTMQFADEIVPADELDVGQPSRPPTEREVQMARQLVETLHTRFDPTRYKDEYREAVLEMIERKARGEEIVAPEQAARDEDEDLLAALEASLR